MRVFSALAVALALLLGVAGAVDAQTPVPTHVIDIRQTNVPVVMSTSGAAATFALNYGEAVVGFTVSGLTASAGTLTPQISFDGGTHWTNVAVFEVGSGNSFATLTADGQYRLNAGGATNFQVVVTSLGTGSAGVSFNASSASSVVTLGGNINVTASNPSVGATGSPTPSSATLLGLNKAGSLTALSFGQGTMANSVPVAIASDQALAVSISGTPSVTISGTPTVSCSNCSAASNASVSVTGSAVPGSATFVGMTQGGNLTGLTGSAGNLNVNLAASGATVTVTCTNCGGGTVTASQGTAAATAGAWPSKITDGTNVAAVKAASTAPVATDPALVVAISPNSGTLTVAGTVNQGTAAVTANAWPHKITDGTNVAAVKAASTAPVATDPALVVAISPNTGTLNVTGTISCSNCAGTNASVSTTGSAAPGSATFVGMTQGGNLTGLTGASGNLNVNLAASGATVTVSGTITATQATGTNLHVVCDSGCSSSTAPADESAFTAGTTSQTPVGGFFQTTATSNPLTTGQMGAFQVTANRALFTNLRNAAGTEIATSGSPLRIDPTGTTTQPVSVAATVTVGQATGTNLHIVCDSGCSSSTAPADESAFTAGTTSQTPVGGFFQTTATSNPLTTGQMGAFQVTANRALFTNLRNAAGAEIATSGAPLRIDPTGTTTQPVSISGALALTADTTATGALTTAGTVVLNTQGAATATFTITGTAVSPVGTLQGLTSGSATWVNVPSLFQGGAGSLPAISPGASNFAAGNGTYVINTAGFTQVRLNLTGISSGTLNVFAEAGAGQQLGFGVSYIGGSNSLLAGVSNPSSIGDATTIGNSLLVVSTPYLYNGTNQDRARSVQALGDAVAGIGMTAVGAWGWNGTTWDRLKETSGALNVTVTGTATISGTVTANQGTANTAANGWPTKITDGTNVAAVKAASTAPVATDPAIVVAISPNTGTLTVAGSGTFTTSDSHFPASAALSDAVANPTTTQVGSNNEGWDATNSVWRRLQVDAGTGTLKVDASAATVTVAGTGSFTVTGTTTANQGTAAATASAWPTKITDGTNTAAVKAASTAPAATDPAVVVALSPNSLQSAAADRNVTGTLVNPGDVVAIPTTGMATVGWYTTGAWVGTIVQEVTYDTTSPTWFTVQTFDSNTSKNLLVPSSTAGTGQWGAGLNNDPWITNVAGAQQFRLRAVAMTSGTVNVILNASVAPGANPVYQTNANNLKARLSDGTTDTSVTLNGALYVNHRDSLGREIGVSIPGQPTIPEIVAFAPGFPQQGANPLRPTSTIILPAGPGTVTLPANGPGTADRAQVFVQALAPSLQCPFVASLNTTASAVVIPGRPGKRTMICEKFVNLAGAEGVSLSEGTGAVCATGTTFLSGGSGGTIALAANGGFVGASDRITLPLQVAGDDFCLVKSGANNASGHVTYGYY